MPLKTFAEYEKLAAAAHGHLGGGQILGLGMGLTGPVGAGRKGLIPYVEIDRCATDAIAVLTGCRLGKRALKFRDFGKVAATFCDLSDQRAVRLVARDTAKPRARERYPEILDNDQQQMHGYRQLSDEERFERQWVRVSIGVEDLSGYKAARVMCALCGEGINFRREVVREGRTLCRACAGKRYYEPLG